ncbi:hypothetical protein ACQJ0Y_17010 [Peribacillus simplex]
MKGQITDAINEMMKIIECLWGKRLMEKDSILVDLKCTWQQINIIKNLMSKSLKSNKKR